MLGHCPRARWALLLLPFAVEEQSMPSHLRKYSGSVLLLGKEIWGSRDQPISRYRAGDFAAYRRGSQAQFDAPIARTGRNIILVVVESLSAADSYSTSGVRNMLPRFDDLSRQGILFRNFFANFEASEGGIVALLSGVPPLHFPTASTDTFGEYALQRSIVESFKGRGYHCEFLTSVPLQFISMDQSPEARCLGSVCGWPAGRFHAQGRARFGFESPSDRALYEELLARLDSQRE